MDSIVREAALKLDCLDAKTYYDLLKYGFMTGSKVLGGYNPDISDIDICIEAGASPLINFDRLLSLRLGYYPHDYADKETFTNIYCKSPPNGEILNILIFHDHDTFNKWRIVTNHIRKMINVSSALRNSIQNKKNRVALFELLLDIL